MEAPQTTPTHFEMTSTEPRRLSRRESELSETDSASGAGEAGSAENLVNAIRDSLSKPALSSGEQDQNPGEADDDDGSSEALLPADSKPAGPPPGLRLNPSLKGDGAMLLSPTMMARPVQPSAVGSSGDDMLDYDLQGRLAQNRLRGLEPWLLSILCLVQAVGTVIMVGFSGKAGFGSPDYAPPAIVTWSAAYCVFTLLSLLVISVSFVLGPLREMFPDTEDIEDKVGATTTFGFPTTFSVQLVAVLLDAIMMSIGTALIVTGITGGQVIRSNAAFPVLLAIIVVGWISIFTYTAAAISTFTILRPLWKADVEKRVARRNSNSSKVAPVGQTTSLNIAGSYGTGVPSVALGRGNLIPGDSVQSAPAQQEIHFPAQPIAPLAPIAPPAVAANLMISKMPLVGGLFKKFAGIFGRKSKGGFQQMQDSEDAEDAHLNQVSDEADQETLMRLSSPPGTANAPQAGGELPGVIRRDAPSTRPQSFLDFMSPKAHSGTRDNQVLSPPVA